MQILEKDIEARVVKWAQKNKFLVVKVRFHDVGYPDRLFISPKGHTIFIEFKRPGEKPEPIQAFRIRMLRARNIPAYWTDSFIGGVTILKAALEPETVPEESDSLASIASLGGVVLGSRTRENVYGTRLNQNPEESGPLQESIDRMPDSADVSDVAGRDQEVD